MSLELIIRLIGMVVAATATYLYTSSIAGYWQGPWVVWTLTVTGAAAGLLIAPWLTIRPVAWFSNRINDLASSQMFAGLVGLIVGLAIAALLTPALTNLPPPFGQAMPFIVSILLGYFGLVVLMRRHREIFAFVSARLARDGLPGRRGAQARESDSVLLDTSVIIDGRIADISRTGFIGETMLVPRFVLNELQHIADSGDPLRRNRGRRGLDMLNKLKKESVVPIVITDLDVDEVREVDDKLVMLAKQLRCPIVTNDYNLNRVAELQGVIVLNVNELTNAVRVILLPGETLQIRIIQEGKEVGQGVGYLDDGTMVVVENGKRYLNQTIMAVVTKVLQTAAGRMIFAQPSMN